MFQGDTAGVEMSVTWHLGPGQSRPQAIFDSNIGFPYRLVRMQHHQSLSLLPGGRRKNSFHDNLQHLPGPRRGPVRPTISEIYKFTQLELPCFLSLRSRHEGMDTIRDLFRLRPSEASRSSQNEAIKSIQPILTIHLPGYGSVRMTEPSPIENEPRQDYVLNGVLEVFIPQPLGRLRCRSIKIGFRSVLTLRGVGQAPEEEDTLYDTEANLRGSGDGGEYTHLEVGTQRYVQPSFQDALTNRIDFNSQ
jgi:hypothetical protein